MLQAAQLRLRLREAAPVGTRGRQAIEAAAGSRRACGPRRGQEGLPDLGFEQQNRFRNLREIQ